MQKAVGNSGGGTGALSYKADGLKAIGLMCLAIAFFSALDTTAKYLATVAQMPATQVVWIRFLAQFLLIVMVLGAVRVPSLLVTRKLPHQLARSMLMLMSTLLNFLALKYLRLDQTQTMYFLTPLTVALLAGPFLGEWVGWRRMVAILVGFLGILVVVRPGVQAFHIAFVFSFGSMLCYALFALLTRYLSAHDPVEVTLFYSLVAGAYFMAPFALVDWVWPESELIWLLLISLGFWGGVGHYIFILAHRYAPASTVTPFIYVGLVTHSSLGFVVFGDVPDRWTLVGSAIVIGSGLYLLYRERVRSGERRPS
jgi:drug/metabolite transporter (DMT)-like permease